ncbi:MAG: Uncharacterized protein, similar to the N-terminal domain of Lon protease, partial [uncultured Nocardioides sp.]
ERAAAHPSDVPPEHGALPGGPGAAARVRGPVPRPGAPPAARAAARAPDVRLGGDPRGLRGRRPRRAVALPGRLPPAAQRGGGAPRRHLRHRRRRPRPDQARRPGDLRGVPCGPRERLPRAPRRRPGRGGRPGQGDVHGVPRPGQRVPGRPLR